ncbi:bi-domain-containing oxidoreductase [Kangiella sp. HZ709]|uniref:bi-domain-containing oxidoreductase n=1 Tax=Kangiella sp. HZ709 TaxID=2666328 RepID=UPI0012AFDD90|nr:bi-domain-containing oxidoreductase [Kangiella sp. HZ709]MRX27150.1 zinc-binding dehydrogenase [Kangiella sp. HZ709]
MRQIFQDLKTGEMQLNEIPYPKVQSGHVNIKTNKTLVSIGTERMLVDFGKAGWIEKARSQPDKVKMVLEKAKTDGLSATYDAVKSKLDQPLPLGYCNVGIVLDGSDTGFENGTRVVSNGNHAEVVRVPQNLVAIVPDNVDDESASFTVLGSIAMQGIRLINPTIGETVVVTGLGLIGLLAVQILKANGCRVLGIDFDSAKCELAKQFGAEVVDLSKGEDPLVAADAFSRGRGVDAVLITASSKSNDIMHQAATMSRKRGRIVLVGVVGLELSRADFYEKELTFQVSCSYGPGRYDEEYEDKGKDYPFAFVRWTEQRNFEAILDLMSSGTIDVQPLISHRFAIDDAKAAYEKLDDRSSLGIVLDYTESDGDLTEDTVQLIKAANFEGSKGNVAFIGGGNYASRVLIPAFKQAGANLTSLVTSGGVSAVHHGKKNGFANASTDIDKALDGNTDTVVIATQHNLHAPQAIAALEKDKHVFVEKPLALTHDEINAIEAAQERSQTMMMVGYNRRFSPQVQQMKSLLDTKACPKTFIMTMNAGDIPKEHWTQDPVVGGGRIIGEACHYIDLMRFLAGSKIKSFQAIKMGENDFIDITEDKAIITLSFEDGSVGSIHYFANGGKSFPKERVEVFCDHAALQLDNFRKLTGFGWNGFTKMNLWSQDKGQSNCTKAFMDAVKNGGQSPIPQEEIFEVARASVDIAELLR